MHTRPNTGILAVVLASFLWGTTGTAASLVPDISPLAIGAFAMGVAALLLGLHSARALTRDAAQIWSNPKLLLIGGASVAVYPLAFYSSMRLSGVAVGTVISIASAPFFSAVLERFINHKPIGRRWLISFLFGVTGIALIFYGKIAAGIGESTLALVSGVALGLLAGLTYATYSWVARCHIDAGVKSRSSMAAMFLVASVVLLPSLAITGDNLFSSPINAAVSLYMALVPMFLGYLLFGYGLRFIEASQATLITLLEPAVAVLLAVIWVGEAFALSGWLGLASILLCIVLQVLPLKRAGSGH